MKQYIRVALLVLVGFSLWASGGCTQLPGINDQGFAGITDVHVKLCPIGDPATRYEPCEVRWRDGKEKASVAMSADLKAGTISYDGKTVLAFDGQKARAEVEKVLADNQGKAIGELVPLIVEAVKKGL